MSGLKINAKFAQKYEAQKRRQELSKLRDLEAEVNDESSESEEEDEEAKLLTENLDEKITQTIEMIRKKDPKIYNKDVQFFTDLDYEAPDTSKEHKKKEKPMFLKDYVRKQLLETGTLGDSDSDSDPDPDDVAGGGARATRKPGGGPSETKPVAAEKSKTKKAKKKDAGDMASDAPVAYTKEQEQLKKAFWQSPEPSEPLKKAKKKQQLVDDDDEDDFFTLKQKTEDDIQKEEKEYKLFANEQAEKTRNEFAESVLMNSLAEGNGDPNDPEDFLRDYIVNKRWLDTTTGRVPSYEEIVNEEVDVVDEEDVEKAEEFEAQYNFRFEEPGGTQIVSHPRVIDDSVRKKDKSRKDARQRKKERQLQERTRQVEELKRLKNLKKEELLERLNVISKVAGTDANALAIDSADLEEDFDPDTFDKKMQEMFNDEYYADEGDIKKPTIEEIDEALDVPDFDEFETAGDADPGESIAGAYEDSAAADPKRKKGRKGKLFLDVVREHKQRADLKDDVQKILDEYYRLDHEDVIAGEIKCRFKYRPVDANDFGLSVDEILENDDKDLNQKVSLKKIAPYRTAEDHVRDRRKSWGKWNAQDGDQKGGGSHPHGHKGHRFQHSQGHGRSGPGRSFGGQSQGADGTAALPEHSQRSSALKNMRKRLARKKRRALAEGAGEASGEPSGELQKRPPEAKRENTPSEGTAPPAKKAKKLRLL